MKLKNALATGILASSMVFMFTGCSKDDDNNSNNTPAAVTASMTAKVDGVAWTSLSNRCAGSIMNGISNLTGIATDSTVIVITIQDEVAAGDTVDIGFGSGNAGAFALDPNGTAFGWSSNGNATCTGEFIVTALDATNKRMSGTFKFKAHRASDNTFKNITDGVFTNVTYSTSISGGGSNTFSVKIDGVTFTPAVISGTAFSGNILITGSDSQGSKSVGINVPDNVTPGTYAMGTIGDTHYGIYNPNSSTYYASTSGSVTITSHNTATGAIAGTFSFVAAPFGGGSGANANLTNGTFNVTY